MFGIQVSLYFINSLLTITIFPNIVIIIIITENYMLQSFFSRSFCLLSVFLVRCLVDRGFCWRRLTLSVLFRLMTSSRPGFPFSPFSSNALSSWAVAELSPACVLVPPFGIFLSKLLTSRKIRQMVLQAFSIDRFFVTDQRSAQVMNPVNRWPLQRTHAREKAKAA